MTSERHVPTGEYGERQEDIEISANSLIQDNHSPAAEEFLNDFNEARLKGDLTVVQRCSDARLKSIGRRSVSVSSIAAARTPDAKLVSDRGSGRGIVLTHLDGDTIIPGKMPAGCGGLAAKEIEDSVQGEIAPYITDVVAHKDPFIQSLRSAERIAYLSGKPTAALAIDHLTDDIYPIAFFQRRGNSIAKVSSISEYEIENYDPEKIYAEGIPTIDESELSDEIQILLEQNRVEQANMHRRYPDIRQRQKVQRPRVALLSTDPRSAKKFPRLASIPGSIFKVFVDREKLGDEVRITPDSITMALRQLSYPLSHAVNNHNNPELPFSNTDRLIIETPSLDLSRKVWDEALEKPDVQNWINTQGNRAILLQTNAGRVNDATEIFS